MRYYRWVDGTVCDETDFALAGECQTNGMLTPVTVIPTADWQRLVAYCNAWMTAHHCEGHCAECDEDDEIRAIIARTEAAND